MEEFWYRQAIFQPDDESGLIERRSLTETNCCNTHIEGLLTILF